MYNAYTDWISYTLEHDYAEFFDGSKIDRKQMYSELKFHYFFYESGWMTANSNPAEIAIYSDGRVEDPRW